MKKPAAFMSYAHRDDKDKRLTKLRERLSYEVSVRTGEDFEIFQDSDAIQVGENWKRQIEESLDEAIFLIPVITPSFFNSQYCRDELRRFLTREQKLGRDDLVLPVYYIDSPLLNDEARRESDELAQVIATRQYDDWRKLQYASFSSPQIRRTLGKLATQIRDALERVQEAPPVEHPTEEAKDREALLRRYREAVESVWTDGELNRLEVEWLSKLANDELGLSLSATADIEREVMGDTKEAILERQEQAAREEQERQTRLAELYAQARRLHRDQEWQAVVDVFDRIHALDPAYPDPEGLLVSARDALATLETTITPWNAYRTQLLRTLIREGSKNWMGKLLLGPLEREGHTRRVVSVAFSPDGRLLASGSVDNTVRLWQVEDGAFLRSLDGHTYWVWSVAFSPDGRLLASGSEDHTMRLWQVEDGAFLCSLLWHTDSVASVAFSPDGRLLASGGDDKTVRLWGIA